MRPFVSAFLCFVSIQLDLQQPWFGVRMTSGRGLRAKQSRIIHIARRSWLAKSLNTMILKGI